MTKTLDSPEEQTFCPLHLQSFPKAPPAPTASLLPAAAAVSDETRICFLENWQTANQSLSSLKKKFTPLSPEVILPFIKSILVRVVSDPELAQKNSDDILTSQH